MGIRENYKKIILVTAAIILLIAGIFYYNKTQKISERSQPIFVIEKDPKLSQEERKIFEERLAFAEGKIKNPPEGATDDEKYGWNMQAGYQKLLLGKFLEAKGYFLAASEIRPTYFTVYVALYENFINMTDYDSARENIKKAIERVPNNADIWRKYIQLEKEKFDATNEQLEQIYSEALTNTAGSVDIVTVYARFLEEKGDLKGAIDQWQKAIELYPVNRSLYQQEITRINNIFKKIDENF